MLNTACVTQSGYWVPPKAPPNDQLVQVVDSTRLPDPPMPALEATPTPEIQFTATPQAILAPETTAQQPGAIETLALPTFASPTATPLISEVNSSPILYYAQAADTLRVVAIRFGVQPYEISSTQPIPETGFINPGQLLIIPRRLANTTASQHLIPDSEVVYSPSAVDFDAVAYTAGTGGYLRSYQEWHRSVGLTSGSDIIMRVAIENSVNPRLLLALIEYQSGWVFGQPISEQYKTYPMGYFNLAEQGLYNQLVWAVNQLSVGYYAYREGRLTDIQFRDGSSVRLAPDLNAGTAALQYYFAQLYQGQRWLEALDVTSGFPALHARMFEQAWARAQAVEPLFPIGIVQPPLNLPFGRNWTWAFTGGPHGAWEHDGAYAALDFAPGTSEGGCHDSNAWVVAMSAGLVVRTGVGLVVLDLDGDGHEQTGWVVVYLHIATKDRIPLGTWLAAGERLGHASCEGGFATGTHIHIARKFNGEWVPADGPLPFNLGGWIAHAGNEAYQGTLTRDGKTLIACVCSNYLTFITRTDEDP